MPAVHAAAAAADEEVATEGAAAAEADDGPDAAGREAALPLLPGAADGNGAATKGQARRAAARAGAPSVRVALCDGACARLLPGHG